MSLSDAQRNSNLDLRYYEQGDYGEAPSSPTMQSLRVTKEMFKPIKKTVVSKVLGTRHQENILKVGEEAQGGFSGEFAWGEFDPFFEGLLGNDFTAETVTHNGTTIVITFEAADSSINSSADFANILAGSWIWVTGTTNHNGLWYVSSKSSSSKLILSNGVTAAGVTMTVQDESPAACVVKMNHLRPGDLLKSYTFERKNTDNNTWDVWNAFVVDNVKLSLKADDLVMIEVSGIGKVFDGNNVATISGSVTAASTNKPINSTNNVMRIKEGSTVLSDELVSTDIDIKVGARNRTSLGNATPTGAAQGKIRVTGSKEFYFLNNTRRQAMQDHTAYTTYFILKDPTSSKFFILTITNLYYQDLDNSAQDEEGDTLEKYTFDSSKDGTYSQTVTIDSLS
jgi:hypothetical protein